MGWFKLPELSSVESIWETDDANILIHFRTENQQKQKSKLMNAAMRAHFAGSKHKLTNE